MLYDLEVAPPGWSQYNTKPRPFFVRVARDGASTRPVELARDYANHSESWALLGSAEGRYVAVWYGRTGGVVMPHENLNARRSLPGPRNDRVIAFFWTGNAYVLMTDKAWSLLDSSGIPIGDSHPLPDGWFDRGGAGDGRGNALLIVAGPYDLFGRILTTRPPKRRAARK